MDKNLCCQCHNSVYVDGGRHTAMRSLQRLIDRGLVVQNEPSVVQIAPQMVQNEPKIKEERSKEENIINKSMHASSFEEFWSLYDTENQWSRSKNRTRQYFETMPLDWQQLAIEKAKTAPAARDPYWFLKDEDFRRVVSAKKGEPAAPKWLTGEEQDQYMSEGRTLVVCQNPETNRFGAVTKEDADKFGLTIHRTM